MQISFHDTAEILPPPPHRGEGTQKRLHGKAPPRGLTPYSFTLFLAPVNIARYP